MAIVDGLSFKHHIVNLRGIAVIELENVFLPAKKPDCFSSYVCVCVCVHCAHLHTFVCVAGVLKHILRRPNTSRSVAEKVNDDCSRPVVVIHSLYNNAQHN